MNLKNNWKWLSDYDLSDYSLIIPSVAVGNVGQLACDLLISSLEMEKIASIYTPAQIPVVGCNPYNLTSSELSTSCELYISTSHNLLVLQIRAPFVHKYASNFLESLVDKFQQKHIKDLIILTSSYAHEKKHIMTSPFRYISSDTTPLKEKLQTSEIVPHEQEGDELRIFGGGFAAMLFKICQEKGLPCCCLYKYCSEGDNVPDAYDMVYQIQRLFSIFGSDRNIMDCIVQPASWRLLFGRPPPQEIY